MAYENNPCRKCRALAARCPTCRATGERYRARLRKEGRCTCGRPARPGYSNCSTCAAKARAISRDRIKRGLTAQQRWDRLGLCVLCGGPRDQEGIKRCRPCLARHRVRTWMYANPDVPPPRLGVPLPEIAIEPVDRLEIEDFLGYALARADLSPRQMQALDLRFGLSNRVSMLWREMAEAMGMTRAGAYFYFQGALARIRNGMELAVEEK